MPTIVGLLTFMSGINFSLSCAEHEKKFFITLGSGLWQVISKQVFTPYSHCNGLSKSHQDQFDGREINSCDLTYKITTHSQNILKYYCTLFHGKSAALSQMSHR